MRNSQRQGAVIRHTHRLESPDLALDLSADPWNLKDGEASFLLGLDVNLPRGFQPDRGRRSIGVSLDEEDRPLTSVIESDTEGFIALRKAFLPNMQSGDVFVTTTATYDPSNGRITQGALFNNYRFMAQDKFAIFSPEGLKGIYPVLERPSGGAIDIPSGLSPGVALVTNVKGVICSEEVILHIPDVTSTQDALFITPQLYAKFGGWDPGFDGGTLFRNPDARNALGSAPLRHPIQAVSSLVQPRDALLVTNTIPAYPEWLAGVQFHKSVVTGLGFRDFRGIIVSNGRKFWRVHDGVYTLVMDLGDDDFLGLRWRGARIAGNRFLLVSPGAFPRVLHLDRRTTLAEDESLAGCIAPRKPEAIEQLIDLQIIAPSWLMFSSLGGSLEAGEIRVMVRGVNNEDAIYSSFVSAVASSFDTVPTTARSDPADSIFLSVAAGSKVSVFTQICRSENPSFIEQFGYSPPIHGRITQIEIWRTIPNAATFYREAVIDVADRTGQELSAVGVRAISNPAEDPLTLAQADLTGLPVLTDSEFSSGGLPPVCRDAASLLGITLCFGKGDESVIPSGVPAYNFNTFNGTYVNATGVFTFNIVVGGFDSYIFQAGDVLEIFGGGHGNETTSIDRIPSGRYPILSSNPGGGTVTIQSNLVSGDILNDVGGIRAAIRREYTPEYPKILDDEQVWYSRTDKFAPENFPPRVLTLSRFGDKFRKAVILGDFCVVIMDQGIHVLYLDGTTLKKETIAQKGMGTPWEDSVTTLGSTVFWASSQGIRTLQLVEDPSAEGRRGKLGLLKGLAFESWFREALDQGDVIDAGTDSRNNCLRFRRKKSDGTHQVLQCSFSTGRCSLLDDDNGLLYAASSFVDSEPKDYPALHSVESRTGQLFEVNNSLEEDPYPGAVVQGKLITPWEWDVDRITHPSSQVFSSKMIGEVLILRISGQEIRRTILDADGKNIHFDPVAGIIPGTEFLIGAIRFRCKFAPLLGESPSQAKTLHGLTLKARKGIRTSAEKINVHAYEGFSPEKKRSSSVPVFDDGDPGFVSQDRVSSLEAQSPAIELEIESLETRSDFKLEMLEATVLEESSEVTDENV